MQNVNELGSQIWGKESRGATRKSQLNKCTHKFTELLCMAKHNENRLPL